ncbi:alpha/beta fold hydrolase [Pseudidiomarina sediminum]|uniref:alpha/beta fold hydrolase n=1 Tax=Pseudidiomarina sediminum TaxID=431675 RepID=UPI001C94935B|nr:alpha/beta fold hydrolase [Pseudidiomarina sediminum]MBY6065001.1 lysophospholipase [Pseudidiomarina sediminum]
MKLVLLPGMDGTGDLFSDFLVHCDVECLVIPLPRSGSQDAASIAKTIEYRLPDEDIVVLGESFSGPVVAELIKNEHHRIIGVVFIASFLSPPNRALLAVAKLMPIKLLSKMPFSKTAYRYLFFSSNTPATLLNQFNKVLESLPQGLLKSRLSAMQHQKPPAKTYTLPALYIRATNDRLVPKDKAEEFTGYFNNLTIEELDGPHFILQTRPKEAAQLVNSFLSKVVRTN